MKKLLCNSLIASVVAVAGATTFVSEAHAQSVDVDFSGSVGNTCEITKLKNGAIGVADLKNDEFIMSSRPDESSNGELGQVEVNCNASGTISVSPLSAKNPDATSLLNLPKTTTGVAVRNDTDMSQPAIAGPNKTAIVSPNGTAETLYVHAVVFTNDFNTPIPAGNYAFSTTVTITPQ